MHTIPINTEENSLEILGGKGRSLAKMTRSGFRVPDGFIVTADAYRDFVSTYGIQEEIIELAKPDLKNGYPNFEECSKKIQLIIERNQTPEATRNEIIEAYEGLRGTALRMAVRSSANAEDLPEFSFAGQQETFLNISTSAAIIESVHKCWASLWTPQAMSYRHQNGIDQSSVAMAVVVQKMIPSEVSGILFTANPSSGERSQIILNSSFGLGEAVVSGQVTPDTFIVDRQTLNINEKILGPKEQKIVSEDGQGVRIESTNTEERTQSSLSDEQIKELVKNSLQIESIYSGQPQDIEWAFCNGELHLLQSRPITNLPAQPIEVEWKPTPPARFVSRRQIVENMPEPICPLFEELYLTRGLEAPRKKSLMAGGGPMFVTVNGYAYQRFDWPGIIKEAEERKKRKEDVRRISEEEIEAEEYKAFAKELAEQMANARTAAIDDIPLFKESLNQTDRSEFESWYEEQRDKDIDSLITMPKSDNSTFVAFNNTRQNDGQLKWWYEKAEPRLRSATSKWRDLELSDASDEELLAGITELGIEEGYYWSSGSGHTFGVAKSTDDQLQAFLRETLPDQNFISGQFLTGIKSKTMDANAHLFKISQLVRKDPDLIYMVLVTPSPFLMDKLRNDPAAKEVTKAIDDYLQLYGHQGYSMDFIAPTQIEDPSALFATLKGMVRDEKYHPDNQAKKTAQIRQEKMHEISNILSGLEYWQFRFRLWLALKYNFIREEVAFLFGFSWSVLRPMAFELGGRLVKAGIFYQPDDIFFMRTTEIEQAIKDREAGNRDSSFGQLARERRELREARKAHHPPGTLPPEASEIDALAFKETQIKNDDADDTMRGFPVSSGKITAKASVILGPTEFDNMEPGTILVSPLTTPAWTQLFAHAVGLVTDVGSILAHGSIVAREYGIPAVLGVGNGTKRIRHGQTITIDGDRGIVEIHEES